MSGGAWFGGYSVRFPLIAVPTQAVKPAPCAENNSNCSGCWFSLCLSPCSCNHRSKALRWSVRRGRSACRRRSVFFRIRCILPAVRPRCLLCAGVPCQSSLLTMLLSSVHPLSVGGGASATDYQIRLFLIIGGALRLGYPMRRCSPSVTSVPSTISPVSFNHFAIARLSTFVIISTKRSGTRCSSMTVIVGWVFA